MNNPNRIQLYIDITSTYSPRGKNAWTSPHLLSKLKKAETKLADRGARHAVTFHGRTRRQFTGFEDSAEDLDTSMELCQRE